MATTTQIHVRARPAHTSGPTYLSYTPDGTKLVTVGSNNTARVYKTGFDGEPTNIDDCQEQNLAVDSTNDFFIAGSEDGTVAKYSFDEMLFEKFLMRCSLPVRDVAISSDGNWCAVSSDELTVKIVKTNDVSSMMYIRDLTKPVKHLSFDPSGKYISLSCTDGIVYFYSLMNNEPELVRKIDDLIRTLETASEISSKIAWHPDGRAFAAPTATRDIQVISRGDWEKQRVFPNGHMGDITALAWSPNGAMLASAGKDRKILLWETKTQSIIAAYNYGNVMDLSWHPSKNLLSFTNTDGEVYIYNDFVPAEHAHLVKLGPQPAPFIHDPLSELSANLRRPNANGHKDVALRGARHGSPDSLDDILGSDIMGDEDDFVVDDDGAGYALGLNGNGKRPGDHLDLFGAPMNKRRVQNWEPQYHECFQPGATPWRGNRKYLCLNLIGFVWTVDQDIHNTVTVEFYDHEFHRDFHFTDTFFYDKACLNENGTLFSCPANKDTPATVFYRPHETWTARADWRTHLPKGEDVTAISLSESFITVTTTSNYVRIYTLFGVPYRVYRQKSSPTVTCASWRDYVLTLGNGPVGADGNTKLLYTIENIKRDEVCQSEDIVALPDGATLKSVFFSDHGDPCIYDSTGVLLTLLHWRHPSQATWIPLLDTKLLSRLASGRKTETYFPIAVADSKFHCIILKGGDQYPYFPRPLLSEFDFQIPLSSSPNPNPDSGDADEDAQNEGDETRKLEGEYVLKSLMTAQQRDLLDSTTGSSAQRSVLARMELEIDKTLLQMMAVECREGEERGMKALELVTLLRDRSVQASGTPVLLPGAETATATAGAGAGALLFPVLRSTNLVREARRDLVCWYNVQVDNIPPIESGGVRTFTMPKSLNESLNQPGMAYTAPEGGRSLDGVKKVSDGYSKEQKDPLRSIKPVSNQGITFAAQDKLPKLPIPELESSMTKYLAALKPLQTVREHAETQQAVEEFLKSEGPDLQERLKKYANGKTSYIEQFWYDSYLNFDNPVVLNLNPFFLLEDDPTPARNNQVTRAASLVVSALSFVRAVRREELPPDTIKGTPLCMYQYSRLFGTARVPTENGCHIGQDPDSKHIVVLCHGQFYWFDVLDSNSDQIMTERDISINLQTIVDDAQQTPIQEAAKGALGVLSTENRKTWSNLRDVITKDENSNNADCLGIVDTALFILCLDYTEPTSGAALCQNMLCGTSQVEKGVQIGTCTNRWYDKLQIIVCKNGSAGINFEHTGVDGHTVLRFASDLYTDTILRFARTINGQAPSLWASSSPDPSKRDPASFGDVSTTPHKLEWDMIPELGIALRFAETRLADLIQQNEFETLDFAGYGKNFMTAMGFSPDAFVQMAFQAAYYGLYGRVECTYEPAMTKVYLHGRTEAIRTVSPESVDFVQKFWAENPPEQKVEALKKACQKHTANTRECAKAQGCDRHMYALFSVWQKALDEDGAEAASISSNGYSSPVEAGSERDPSSAVGSPGRNSILSQESSTRARGNSSPSRPAHSMPHIFADPGWDKLNNTIISTSNCGNPSLRHFGFGPTTGDGFGIGYIIKDDGVSICASSKHRQTKRFVDALEGYLLEIRRVLKATQRRGASPKASRAREAESRPTAGHRVKSRGRVIKANEGGRKSAGTMTPDESAIQSDDEGLGGYGFFDAGMLLQALKARGEGYDEGAANKPSDRATARRREIGKKLRLSEY
ncbi:hypothetical protein B7494_g7880 [Chlorociboria aeruginascens]|nr:hypothetical protein B7494_g7880 [Chlorociboria aeruginascens]